MSLFKWWIIVSFLLASSCTMLDNAHTHARCNTWSRGSTATLPQLNYDTLKLCLHLLRHFIPLLRLPMHIQQSDWPQLWLYQGDKSFCFFALCLTLINILHHFSLCHLHRRALSLRPSCLLSLSATPFLCPSQPCCLFLRFFLSPQSSPSSSEEQRGSSSTPLPLISSLQSPNTNFLLHCFRQSDALSKQKKGGKEKRI